MDYVFCGGLSEPVLVTMRFGLGSVLVFIITLLVYVYLFNIDLNNFEGLHKNEPNIDTSTNLTMDILVEDQIQYPNLPVGLWKKRSEWSIAKNESYAELPRIFDLQFSNDYWQVFQSTNETFQLLNAYYDNRRKNPWRPSIRIIGMINTYHPTTKTYCQLWFEDSVKPKVTQRIHYHWMWRSFWPIPKQIFYQPYILTCRIPQMFRRKIPSAVSVVENHNDTATNVLRLIYNKPRKKKPFAVCVKGLDFFDLDISVRLVEWIELLKILGANDIYFYKLNVHSNVSKVLQHYQKLGYVDVRRHTLPGEDVNIPLLQHKFLYAKVPIKRLDEVIIYNDCLYRNLYSYKHIALLDVDEMIIPRNTDSWAKLLDIVKKRIGRNVAICTRVGFFLDQMSDKRGRFRSIPKYLHMLQHVFRSKVLSRPGFYTKCFHNPNLVISLHNHLPIAHFNGSLVETLPVSQALLHHFRHDCIEGERECGRKYMRNIVLDDSIWKYKKDLITRCLNRLKELNFL